MLLDLAQMQTLRDAVQQQDNNILIIYWLYLAQRPVDQSCAVLSEHYWTCVIISQALIEQYGHRGLVLPASGEYGWLT